MTVQKNPIPKCLEETYNNFSSCMEHEIIRFKEVYGFNNLPDYYDPLLHNKLWKLLPLFFNGKFSKTCDINFPGIKEFIRLSGCLSASLSVFLPGAIIKKHKDDDYGFEIDRVLITIYSKGILTVNYADNVIKSVKLGLPMANDVFIHPGNLPHWAFCEKGEVVQLILDYPKTVFSEDHLAFLSEKFVELSVL